MIPYAIEIEYLESTGTQYINTGIKLFKSSPTNFEISMKVFANTGQSSNSCILNSMKEVNPYPGIVIRTFGNIIQFTVGNKIATISSCGSVQNITITENNLSFVIDTPVTLFAGLNRNNEPWRYCKLKMYSLSIKRNSELIFDAIPVRVGNVGYMYDRVSGQLFGNSGTGSFVLGPDIAPAAYANEIAFLESTGSQYIDTGYVDNTNANKTTFMFGVKGDGDIIGNKVHGSTTYANGTKIIGTNAAGAFAYYKPTGDRVLLQIENGDEQIQNITTTYNKSNSTFELYVDGDTITGVYSGIDSQTPYTLLIRDAAMTVGWFVGKIYYAKIYEDDVLIHDFIPVEYNNIGYLYDKVSGQFFANQGTGKFVLGHRAPRFDGKACARSYTRRQLMAKAPLPLEKQYFTFKVLSGGTITAVSTNASANRTIQYSLNGGRWQSLAISTTSQSLGTFNIDDEIRIKGNNSNYATWVDRYCHFAGTAQTEVKGNIMSLVYGDNFVGKTVLTANYTFIGLFQSWTNLVSAEDLIMPAMTLRDRCYIYLFKGCSSLQKTPKVLPATNLVINCYYEMFNGCKKIVYPPIISATYMGGDSCCQAMFYNCTSLREAPDLNATTLSPNCYSSMFYNCTALTKAPAILPATTLKTNCYSYMFYQCFALVTAPVLPALTLVSNCYNRTFMNCKKLRYIKAMFTTTPSSATTLNWVYGIPSGGTFVKNSAATWDVTGVSGIPSGWTVQTADE